MASLKGTKSFENLKEAFAGESQANRRYLYFARVADIEGFPDIAGLFKDTADAETGHAFGHLDFLKEVGDPATGEPIGKTEKNLKAAVAGETYEYTQMYPGMAKTARTEGFNELAEWFETLAKAEKSHAGRFNKGCSRSPARIQRKRFNFDRVAAGGGAGRVSRPRGPLALARGGWAPSRRAPSDDAGRERIARPSPPPPPAATLRVAKRVSWSIPRSAFKLRDSDHGDARYQESGVLGSGCGR